VDSNGLKLSPFLIPAEKSGYGSEEGQLERADHDDSFLGDSFHHPFRFGVFDLREVEFGFCECSPSSV
jgi:hypothetical protein